MKKFLYIALTLVLFAIFFFSFIYLFYDKSVEKTPPLPKEFSLTFQDRTYQIKSEVLNKQKLKSADLVLVEKARHILYLFSKGEPFRVYHIALGDNPIGHKHREGDEKTPEGEYRLDWRNPNSVAYLSLHISYPNKSDKAYAKAHGFSAGGDIMIHGIYNGLESISEELQLRDWTDGCIGVLNPEMDEIYTSVKNGTKIVLKP